MIAPLSPDGHIYIVQGSRVLWLRELVQQQWHQPHNHVWCALISSQHLLWHWQECAEGAVA
eukprot:781914-Amphidinium_carterae.1